MTKTITYLKQIRRLAESFNRTQDKQYLEKIRTKGFQYRLREGFNKNYPLEFSKGRDF